jgi:DnaK suppressor protein
MTVLVASPLTQQLAARLRQRADELRALLQRHAGATASDHLPDVVDFKDVAADDWQALIDESTLASATTELQQVVAALRRMDEGRYGECEDCGEPIDERRLSALPATRFCTACQAIHERPAVQRR